MTKKFIVRVRAAAEELSAVLAAISSFDIVSVTQEQMPAAAPQEPAKEQKLDKKLHYHGGRRNKGIKGDVLLQELVADGNVKSLDWLREKFVERGFAPTSISPVISLALKAGTLKVVGPERYIKGDVVKLKIG